MNHLAKLLEDERESPSRWTPFQRVYDRYVFKGGAGEEVLPELQAVESQDGEEPQNYSFLDLLAPSTEEEEHS